MCKCQVMEGGGSILPTETGFFTRKEQQQQWRLGCQVKIREDMSIQIPEEVMGIKKWECEVVSNHNVATFIKELVVELDGGETVGFEAGAYMQIDVPEPDLVEWEEMLRRLREADEEIKIAVVGKYVDLTESYKSLNEALYHGGIANDTRVKVRMVESEDVEKNGAAHLLEGVAGILVPGGFGDRGIEGKIAAVNFARSANIPAPPTRWGSTSIARATSTSRSAA